MPKKPSTKTVESETIVPSVSATSVTDVPKKVKTPKQSKVASVTADSTVTASNVVTTSAPSAEVSVVPSVSVVESSSTENIALVETEVPVVEQSIEFVAKLQQLSVAISSLKTEYRTLEKKWARELKLAQKQSSKRSKRKAGNRAPSGFVKPTRISDELAKFLDKPTGTEMARTEVTREINVYIRENKLQDKENGRKINADPKLAGLLKLKKTDELTYFNLQKYMSPHFAKTVKETTVVA